MKVIKVKNPKVFNRIKTPRNILNKIFSQKKILNFILKSSGYSSSKIKKRVLIVGIVIIEVKTKTKEKNNFEGVFCGSMLFRMYERVPIKIHEITIKE